MDKDNKDDLNLPLDNDSNKEKSTEKTSSEDTNIQPISTEPVVNESVAQKTIVQEVSKKNKVLAYLKKLPLKWVIPVAILLFFNLIQYIGGQQRVVAHQQEMTELKKNYEEEIRSRLLNSSKKQLTMMMKSLAWSVRSSMLRKNNDEIAQYFYEMVQEEDIREVVLVDQYNKISVSTNKKNEQKAFLTLYPDANIDVNKITFVDKADAFHLIAPILSLDQKVGTLFIEMDSQIPPADSSSLSSPVLVTDSLSIKH